MDLVRVLEPSFKQITELWLFDLRHFTVSKDVETEIMQVASEAQGALAKS